MEVSADCRLIGLQKNLTDFEIHRLVGHRGCCTHAGALLEHSIASFSVGRGAKLTRRLQGGFPRSGDLGRSLKKIKIEKSVRTPHMS